MILEQYYHLHLKFVKVDSQAFKDELYKELPTKNYANICRCYSYWDNTKEIAQILCDVIKRGSGNGSNDRNDDEDIDMTTESKRQSNDERELICDQICFNLHKFQNESFGRAIFENIPKPPTGQLCAQKVSAEAQTKAEEEAVKGFAEETTTDGANDNDAPKDTPDDTLKVEKKMKNFGPMNCCHEGKMFEFGFDYSG